MKRSVQATRLGLQTENTHRVVRKINGKGTTKKSITAFQDTREKDTN